MENPETLQIDEHHMFLYYSPYLGEQYLALEHVAYDFVVCGVWGLRVHASALTAEHSPIGWTPHLVEPLV